MSSDLSGNATLPTVKVEADAETDPYDPTNTNNPYNKFYSLSNSSTSMKTDTPIMETPASIQVIPKSVLQDQQVFPLLPLASLYQARGALLNVAE